MHTVSLLHISMFNLMIRCFFFVPLILSELENSDKSVYWGFQMRFLMYIFIKGITLFFLLSASWLSIVTFSFHFWPILTLVCTLAVKFFPTSATKSAPIGKNLWPIVMQLLFIHLWSHLMDHFQSFFTAAIKGLLLE